MGGSLGGLASLFIWLTCRFFLERVRETHHIFFSRLRADQMCGGSDGDISPFPPFMAGLPDLAFRR